ncbi:alpha/beta hydrolase [bacterium]|nr:alpha/beta hydrolase [bacterium]RQV99332.1 MAG: alpha/beta hydrolase [bacterium]
MLIHYLAKALVYPTRRPVVKKPSDYNMSYRDIDFKSKDGTHLKAWYIPGKSEKLIILTHPMPFNRYGFHTKGQGLIKISQVEVELLKTAKHLNDAGYALFMFDFRNHGESDKANNGVCGVGYYEWQDVIGALNYIKTSPELKSKKIGFVSHCMGANATLIAMGKEPDLFNHVQVVVAIQPVSMNVFVPHYLRAKMPIFKNKTPQIDASIKAMIGFGLEDMSPAPYIKDIKVPILYVQVKNDAWTDPSDVQGFYDNTTAPKEIFWIEGDLERFDGYNYFGENPTRMLEFLEKYLD